MKIEGLPNELDPARLAPDESKGIVGALPNAFLLIRHQTPDDALLGEARR